MREAAVRITNTLGLHARAAAQLVRLANSFQSSVTLTRGDTAATANAKSILSVLNLAAGRGVEIKITADGDDEAEALSAVGSLFTGNFGED